MSKKSLILIGGGGHCKACIDVVEREGYFHIVGILDPNRKIGSLIMGYPVLGNDSAIHEFVSNEYYFLVTVGQIKTANTRKRIFDYLKLLNARIATVISPSALVSKYATVGEGSIVMHGVTVNAEATIGENVILNSNSTVEHESIIGSHVHISTGAIVNGDCNIGNMTFIGSNATISNGITIADAVIIGAASLVVNNIENKGIYVGCPVRKID